MKSWIRLVQGSTRELSDILKNISSLRRSTEQSHPMKLAHLNEQEFYAQVVFFYLNNDLVQLEKRIESASQDLNEILILLAQLRLQILKKKLNYVQLVDLQVQVEFLAKSDLMRGELCYVLATAWMVLHEYAQAKQNFHRSSKYFEVAGASKKSLKASMGHLSAMASQDIHARLYVEYSWIYRKATQLNEYQTATAALMNISREYAQFKSFILALEYADKSVELIQHRAFGSREHHLALANRAQIHFKMGRVEDGKKDLQQAMVSERQEVVLRCRQIAEKFSQLLS